MEFLDREYYCDDELTDASDDDDRSSHSSESDNEQPFSLSNLIAGVKPDKKLRPTNERQELAQSFERDMEGELDTAFAEHNIWQAAVASSSSNSGAAKSDEKREKAHAEETFYSSKADDEDAAWVDRKRHEMRPKSDSKKPLPDSDAVLDCPCCMTTLCRDCQRHSTYKSQYRAVFVMNCSVKMDENRVHKKQNKRTTAKKRKLTSDAVAECEDTLQDEVNSENPKDVFHPIHCATCNTEVGVYDYDEIYHFYNVLSHY